MYTERPIIFFFFSEGSLPMNAVKSWRDLEVLPAFGLGKDRPAETTTATQLEARLEFTSSLIADHYDKTQLDKQSSKVGTLCIGNSVGGKSVKQREDEEKRKEIGVHKEVTSSFYIIVTVCSLRVKIHFLASSSTSSPVP